MCGRYYVDDEMANEISRIIKNLDNCFKKVKEGDVCPSQNALVITGKETGLSPAFMQWGFPRFDQKGLIINARAETVTERRTFRDSVLHRRCIIPARRYYEWDAAKEKVTFSRTDSPILYMAGFHQIMQDKERFVVITTQANDSVRKIHDRMPLILEEQELEEWIYNDGAVDFILSRTPAALEHYQEYEQQTLF